MRYLLVALFALAGCQTPVEQLSYSELKKLEADLQKRCVSQGYKPGNPEFKACVEQEFRREASIRQEAADRQNSTTVCNVVGNTVVCY